MILEEELKEVFVTTWNYSFNELVDKCKTADKILGEDYTILMSPEGISMLLKTIQRMDSGGPITMWGKEVQCSEYIRNNAIIYVRDNRKEKGS